MNAVSPEPSLEERLARGGPPRLPRAMYQEWRRLLFVHWAMPPSVLEPLLPPGLSLDMYEGQAYVSLVPFSIQTSRLAIAPRRLGMRFLETNVRTYVHLNGHEPGVYFFSLDATSVLSVIGARISLGLPYIVAGGRERILPSNVNYQLRRRTPDAPACQAEYQVGEPLASPGPGSLDFFLVERYVLHVRRGPTLWTVQVRHRPYPLQAVRLLQLTQNLLESDGLPSPGGAPLVHFSPGVDVDIFPPSVRLIRSHGRQ